MPSDVTGNDTVSPDNVILSLKCVGLNNVVLFVLLLHSTNVLLSASVLAPFINLIAYSVVLISNETFAFVALIYLSNFVFEFNN